MLTRARLWITNLVGRSRFEDELADELAFHIEARAEHWEQQGLTPAEARRRARLEFGSVEKFREEVRDVRLGAWVEQLRQDIRYAVHTLGKSPAFTAVVVFSLALGIGTAGTIFGALNPMLLRPLPFPDPDRLVAISEHSAQSPGERRMSKESTYREWREHNQALEQIAWSSGYQAGTLLSEYPGVVGAGQTTGQSVSPGLFGLLGVEPVLGRHFTPEDALGPAMQTSVILSYGFWQRHFSGDPGIVGQTWAGRAVVGVMPPGFWIYPWGWADPDLWEAWDYGDDLDMYDDEERWLEAIGRLKPGVGIEQAQAELDGMARRLDQSGVSAESGWRVRVEPLKERASAPFTFDLYFLLGAASLVLLIACGNVASLLMGRAVTRQREMTTRAALGAGRPRLMRQMLTENIVLALFGGTLGVLMAHWGTRLFVIHYSRWYLPGEEIRVDGTVLGFTLGLSLLTVVLFGLAPALWASKPDLAVSLKQGTRGAGGASRPLVRNLLVGSQIALALILLTGAGLMLNSLVRLMALDPGFDPDRILTAEIYVEGPDYVDVEQRSVRVTPQVELFYRQLLERLRALPGVEAAETLSRWTNRPLTILGRPAPPPDEQPRALYSEASPGYFRAMEIPLVKGRFFTDRDTASSSWVVIIDESLATRFFPDENPIGKVLHSLSDDSSAAIDDRPREIVGVVGNHRRMWVPARPGTSNFSWPTVFVPTTQHMWETSNSWEARPHLRKRLVIRTTLEEPMGLAAELRSAVAAVDSRQAVFGIQTMEALLNGPFNTDRFWLRILGIFAILAIVLAAVGIYGVIAYSVARRTQEIGVRMALGAQRGDVLTMVLRQGLVLSVGGVIVGVLGAVVATRLIASQLYGVEATDPATFAIVAVAMIGIALLATYFPARRATKVDPLIAMRSE